MSTIDLIDRPGADDPGPDFLQLPDLATRLIGGSVVWANDDLFAERENLIKHEEPSYSAHTFGHKGQVYDGWETRRHRGEVHHRIGGTRPSDPRPLPAIGPE